MNSDGNFGNCLPSKENAIASLLDNNWKLSPTFFIGNTFFKIICVI